MRHLLLALAAISLTTPAWAEISIDPLLNKVTLQLTAEQWVTTKTALVNVGINASLTGNGLETIHAQVLTKLNQLAKGEWHIVAYNRTQDKSGLESVQIAAQARLSDADLAGLRDKAKSISKPGETYTIDNIQFTPSADEIRDANNNLRANIYDQAKAELGRLNKAYPEQKYYLHDVNFNAAVMPYAQNMMLAKTADSAERSAPITVGDKLNMNATVTLAAGPDQEVLKLVH